jgi:LemA protein
MGFAQIAFWVFVAVMVCWAVGAYNRLVRLRALIKQAFATVEAHVRQRDALLAQWSEGLRGLWVDETQTIDAVVAACGQVMAACDHARAWPSGARAVGSLRLAEEVLADARARLTAELARSARLLPAVDLSARAEELAAVDGTLGFARRQYNDAAQAYNDAVVQFPTWVIAGVFGFHAAGAL